MAADNYGHLVYNSSCRRANLPREAISSGRSSLPDETIITQHIDASDYSYNVRLLAGLERLDLSL